MKPKDKIKRFDFAKKPHKPWKWVVWIAKTFVAYPYIKRRGAVAKKVNMEAFEEQPCLILSYHASYVDMALMLKVMQPNQPNNVMTLERFNTYTEPLMRSIGVFGKRRFTTDISLVRNIRYVLRDLKNNMVVYPEARFSLDGCTSYIPQSTASLIKMMKVPVAIAKLHGNFIDHPQWNKKSNLNYCELELSPLFTKEETQSLSTEEIYERLLKEFQYDDFAWQKENGIVIDTPTRAYGLHSLLYKCPNCLCEGETESESDTLRCRKCGKEWFMETDGSLRALNGETEFSHIPDWSNWERECVKKEIEDGTYYFEDEVRLETLPNSWKFYKHGKAKLVQTPEGITISGTCYKKPFELHKSALNQYSLHIEYDYHGKGDCIDISVPDDSYWCYPTKRDVITKLSFATEEIHQLALRKQQAKKKEKRGNFS